MRTETTRSSATTGEAAPALRARGLAVGYRSNHRHCAVLDGVDVAVTAGELVAVVGPNGSGKSTLLRTLARLQPPLAGDVDLGDISQQSMPAVELARRIGVVLTDRVAVDALPVRQIVELGRYPHSGWLGRLTSRDHEVVRWAIDAVGLRALAERDFSRLSDGERQRVMIARALAQQPAVLILDEPTAFLDVPSRVELMGVLRQLTRGGTLAVIVSTHDIELAVRAADALWLLMPGGDVITGTPEDVMLSGRLAQAFTGREIQFDLASRTFRWSSGHEGAAVVHGRGARAEMAKAVLERHGYSLNDVDLCHGVTLTVAVDDDGWQGSDGSAADRGDDFASLSAWIRRRKRES